MVSRVARHCSKCMHFDETNPLPPSKHLQHTLVAGSLPRDTGNKSLSVLPPVKVRNVKDCKICPHCMRTLAQTDVEFHLRDSYNFSISSVASAALQIHNRSQTHVCIEAQPQQVSTEGCVPHVTLKTKHFNSSYRLVFFLHLSFTNKISSG